MADSQQGATKQQKTADQKVMFFLAKEDGGETTKPKRSTVSKFGKDMTAKTKSMKDGEKPSGSTYEQGQAVKAKQQAAVGLRKQTVAQRSQASFQRRQQLASQRSQVMNVQRTMQSGTQKSQIGIQKTTGVSQRSQVSLMKSQSSFQKKQTVTQKNSLGLQKSATGQRSTVYIQKNQGISQRSQANFQRSQASFQKNNDKPGSRNRVSSKVQTGVLKRSPLQKSVSSPDTGDDENFQKKSSVSSDGDTNPVKLYQPKPTLKELAEAGSVAPSRGKLRARGTNPNIKKTVKSASLDYSLFDGVSPDKIMDDYEKKEMQFHEQVAFLYESPQKRSSKTGALKENVNPKGTLGFNHLGNLLRVMEHLSSVKRENNILKRKCSLLEDSRSLLNLQNQMLNASRLKQMNKSESFISKAQSKVKHYLVSPIVHPSTHSYQRVHSDSGSGIPMELMDSPKPKSPKGLKRSTSVGSMEELDLASPILDSPHQLSHSMDKQNKSSSTMRKKVNKRFPKWSKMKRVFSKPESGGKLEGGAISAEEIIRVNKQKSPKNRPSSLAPSKSFDHGDLGGSISDDNCGATNSHLFVEPPRSSPPSPSSVKSEPGTAFPATTPVENEVKDVEQQPSATNSYVDIGDTKSVRTVVRTISQTESSYSTAGIDDRISLSDNESEKSRSFEVAQQVGYPLVRRKSSPTLRKHGSVDNSSSFGLTTPVEIRRSSSFKARTKRQLMDGDRSISNTAYITENLLSPEDAKRAQIQLRSKDGEVHKKAKAAWVKVKDIIHTRKDSIKKTRRRSISGMEEFEISPEGSSWEDRITLQVVFIHYLVLCMRLLTLIITLLAR